MLAKTRKGLIIVASLFLLIVIFSLIYSSVSKKPTQPEYLGMKTYPQAEFVETTHDPNNEELIKTSLKTRDTVPQVSKWYLDNYSQSGWQIDVPPADTNVSDIQYIRLIKGDEYLGVSLIKDDNGQTQIVLERTTKQMQAKGEEEEEINAEKNSIEQ